MGVHIGDNRFVITTKPKTFYFDLPKDGDNNLKHGNDSFIKHNEFLAEHTIKNEIRQLWSKYKHGNDIHGTEKRMNHTNLFLGCHKD